MRKRLWSFAEMEYTLQITYWVRIAIMLAALGYLCFIS